MGGENQDEGVMNRRQFGIIKETWVVFKCGEDRGGKGGREGGRGAMEGEGGWCNVHNSCQFIVVYIVCVSNCKIDSS